VIDQPIRKVLPELEGQPFLDILDNVYRSGESYVGTEFRAMLERSQAGNKEEFFFNFVYQPMRDSDGATEGIIVFAYNVTEQTRSRQHVESLMAELTAEHKRKDEFLAMLAHELRNPLAVIHNAVQLCELSEEFRASTSKHYVGILRRQTRKLTAMVDDLLDVSRVTRGHITLKKEPLDLSRLLRNAVECARSELEEKHHDVKLTLPDGDVRVIGDAVRLDQVFTNLIVNAGKYTDEGGKISDLAPARRSHSAVGSHGYRHRFGR
jgi:signal transduction histidine kinase